MHFLMPLVKKIQNPAVLLIICLSVGSFLRLWNFPNTLQFLGDQGRDAIVAKRILIDHDPALLGPVTSTGNMYLGPLYYYFMVPFLAMSYPSPIGPAYAIAALSILTIALVYYIGKEMFDEKVAVIAMLLTTFANTYVFFARFSWNPNPAPLISLLLIWSTFRAIKRTPKYWMLVGLCLAILVQLHYITLLCLPAAGLIWLAQARNYFLLFKKKPSQQLQKAMKSFVISSLIAVGIFIVSFTPLVIFDFRHHFMNSQSFIHFVTADLGPNQNTLIDRIKLIMTRVFMRTNQMLFQDLVWPNILISTSFLVVLFVTLFQTLKKSAKFPLGLAILLCYLLVSILGLGYYRGAVYSHYYLYLTPIALFCWAIFLKELASFKTGRIISAAFVVLFIIWNVSQYAIAKPLWSINQIQPVTDVILQHLKKPNEKYNIVLLSDSRDIEGQNYRYFLEVSPHPPLTQEHWGEVDTLFIINEDHKLKKVVDAPIYEIVVFPNKTPAEVFTIPGGPEITVLRR